MVAQTTELYCLTVLEARSPRSRCWQAWLLLRAVPGFSAGFWQFVGNQSSLGWQMPHFSFCLHVHMHSSCACVSVSTFIPFYKDTTHIVRAHFPPAQLHLNQLHLQWPYFQIRSHCELLGVRTWTCKFWRDRTQPVQALACCVITSANNLSSSNLPHILICLANSYSPLRFQFDVAFLEKPSLTFCQPTNNVGDLSHVPPVSLYVQIHNPYHFALCLPVYWPGTPQDLK